MLGGEIYLESVLGEGSSFIVELPIARSESETVAEVTKEQLVVSDVTTKLDSLRGRTVLVVDDDPDARDLLSNYVNEHGAIVLAAASGEEALTIAKQKQPDLITLDIMMPGMDGWETLQAFKADFSVAHIPVVIVSIIAEKHKATVLGAVDAVTKPVVQSELLATLKRSLKGGNKKKILVVDDDPDIWELYKDALSPHVDELVFAENGRVGLEKLESYNADMVFLDLMMPEMDGLTFLRVLRTDKHLLSLPVVVVTAKQLTTAERRELELRVVDVVEKGGSNDGRTFVRRNPRGFVLNGRDGAVYA